MKLLGGRYVLLEKCSSGSFSTVYKGLDKLTNEEVAIKCESKTSNLKLLKNEAKIYNYIGYKRGICALKYFGATSSMYYMVTTLLGKPISSISISTRGDFHRLMNVLLYLVRSFHDMGFVHRDISLNNFHLGLDGDIYLIDFGISMFYRDDFQVHMSPYMLSGMMGSLHYVSINVHDRVGPSRRDDIESWVYIVMYLYYNKYLKTPNNSLWFEDSDEMLIRNKKHNFKSMSLVDDVFEQLLRYVRSIKYEESPDYILCESFITRLP